jgi:hypothetical protein
MRRHSAAAAALQDVEQCMCAYPLDAIVTNLAAVMFLLRRTLSVMAQGEVSQVSIAGRKRGHKRHRPCEPQTVLLTHFDKLGSTITAAQS